jgi:hypothetical protein
MAAARVHPFACGSKAPPILEFSDGDFGPLGQKHHRKT